MTYNMLSGTLNSTHSLTSLNLTAGSKRTDFDPVISIMLPSFSIAAVYLKSNRKVEVLMIDLSFGNLVHYGSVNSEVDAQVSGRY